MLRRLQIIVAKWAGHNMDNLELYAKYAHQAYRSASGGRWVAAYWAAKIVGRYDRGATIALAQKLGISPDAVEDMAHEYQMYKELRDDPEFRINVRKCRRWPTIYGSHFRAIYDARNRYDLSLVECMDILIDVVQARGTLSSRDVDEHVRNRYGKERPWTYYAERASRAVFSLRQCPDIPIEVRHAADELFTIIGDRA